MSDRFSPGYHSSIKLDTKSISTDSRGKLFYRDNHQQEIDLLFTHEGRTIGVEIKSAATLQASFIRSLNRIDEKVFPLDEKHLVYSGDETRSYSSGVTAINFKSTFEIMTGK